MLNPQQDNLDGAVIHLGQAKLLLRRLRRTFTSRFEYDLLTHQCQTLQKMLVDLQRLAAEEPSRDLTAEKEIVLSGVAE